MNRRFLLVGGIVLFVVLIMALTSKKETPRQTQAGESVPGAKELYTKASRLQRSREPLRAKEVYQEILVNHPDAEDIAGIQKELEGLNMNIIFSGIEVPGKTVMHEVVVGDTLGKIAKTYKTTVELIKRCNNLKSDIIRIGQRLRVWTGTFNMLVDKSQNILILKDGNEVLKVYNVSTGENNSTPIGTFEIASKLVDPVWFNRGVVVPPESPENVLGTRWLGFDLPGYGIHGTIEPDSIGQQVTAGCVRMLNADVEEIYSLIPKGTKVVIVD